MRTITFNNFAKFLNLRKQSNAEVVAMSKVIEDVKVNKDPLS